MATLKIKANKANNESGNVQNAQVSNSVNESPMMKQFKQLKEKNPNAILLFRCGDFYETYEQDAKDAAEVLGITLTKGDDGVQMAGFPHHALDTYLPKLIRAGKRVAICDQLEAPKVPVKLNQPAATEEPTEKEEKAVTVPLTPAEPISEQPVDEVTDPNGEPDPDAVGEIVDVTANDMPKVEFSTYTTKKGNTAPQIIGFGGEDDPRWQSHKDAGHKYVSASWKKDLNGNKVYILLFGTRYLDVAKALAGAYNTNDREAWQRAEAACMAIYEQAQRDGKARWEAQKAEWAKKSAERKAKKEAEKKCYTKEDVAAMLNDLLAGKDIPEDVKKLLKAA